jgi:hypothetical protein
LARFEILYAENLNEISPRALNYSLDRRLEVTLSTNVLCATYTK